MDDLPCGVILGNEFLYDNHVFSLHEDHLYTELPEDQRSETPAYVSTSLSCKNGGKHQLQVFLRKSKMN